MQSIGTRIKSTYSNHVIGEIVGYGVVNGYTLGKGGEPVEIGADMHVVYLVRLDKPIVDKVTDNAFRASRVVCLREENTETDYLCDCIASGN